MKGYFEVFAIGFRFLKNWLTEENHIDQRLGMFLSIIILFFLVSQCMIEENDLDNYGEWSVGAIYKKEGGKNAKFLYRFYVDSIEYIGSAPCGVSKICIGDSLYVHYDRTNPSNNAPGRYFEYVLDTEQLPDTVYYRRKMNNQRRPLIYQ